MPSPALCSMLCPTSRCAVSSACCHAALWTPLSTGVSKPPPGPKPGGASKTAAGASEPAAPPAVPCTYPSCTSCRAEGVGGAEASPAEGSPQGGQGSGAPGSSQGGKEEDGEGGTELGWAPAFGKSLEEKVGLGQRLSGRRLRREIGICSPGIRAVLADVIPPCTSCPCNRDDCCWPTRAILAVCWLCVSSHAGEIPCWVPFGGSRWRSCRGGVMMTPHHAQTAPHGPTALPSVLLPHMVLYCHVATHPQEQYIQQEVARMPTADSAVSRKAAEAAALTHIPPLFKLPPGMDEVEVVECFSDDDE